MVSPCVQPALYIHKHQFINEGLKHLILSLQRAEELDISRFAVDAINGALSDIEIHLAITVAILDTILCLLRRVFVKF